MGTDGPNVLLGGTSNDKLWGLGGVDRLEGGNGHDWLSGGSGDDVIAGGSGRDYFFGDEGTDVLSAVDCRNPSLDPYIGDVCSSEEADTIFCGEDSAGTDTDMAQVTPADIPDAACEVILMNQ